MARRLFALADGLLALVLGRALIGLGVALALMAGFKAIVLWFPAELILVVVPDRRAPVVLANKQQQIGLMTIYRDRRFWRLAPLSAVGVGTSSSLQGLWAAPWLKDVDG